MFYFTQKGSTAYYTAWVSKLIMPLFQKGVKSMSDCKYERTSAASGRGGNNGCSTCRGETTAAAAECVKCGTNFREAVCIHTDKIYDSCRE